MKARNIKKALGIAMTTAMVFTMAMPAFASGTIPAVTQGTTGKHTPSTAVPAYETTTTTQEQAGIGAADTHQQGGKLTIHGVPEYASNGRPHVYEAYQVFAGDISAELNGTALAGNARILSNVRWGRGVNSTNLVTALNNANITYKENGVDKTLNVTDAQSFAEALSWMENDADNLIAISRIIGENLASKEEVAFNRSANPTGTDKNGVELWDYTSEKKFDAGYYFVKDAEGSQDNNEEGENGNYTRFILKLVGDSVVNAKSETIKVEKKVQEDTKYQKDDGYGTGYNDTSDAEIGETVPYEFLAPIINPSEIEKYVKDYHYIFHDKMSVGLTFQNNVTVEIYGKNASGVGYDANNKKGDATVFTVNTNPGDGDTFDVDVTLLKARSSKTANDFAWNIKFADGKTLQEGDIMVIKFTAVVNDKAVIGNAGNDQEVRLEYSNNPNGDGTGETPEDKVVTFVYELDVNKVDGTDKTALDDAYFVFYKKELDSEGKETGRNLYAVLDGNNKITGTWTAYTPDEFDENVMPSQTQLDQWNNVWGGKDQNGNETAESLAAKAAFVKHFNDKGVSVMVSKDGKFSIEGLDDDTYYLQEVKAPKGYNLLKEVIKVVITADTINGQDTPQPFKLGKLERTFDLENATNPQAQPGNTDTGVVEGAIANNRGTVLPSTGGMGTTLFYAIGGVLLVGAGVLLVSRKRMNG